MERIGFRQPTGTFCKQGHPQFIEVRMSQGRGPGQYEGQVDPTCWRRWRPAHREFMRSQNQRGG